MKTYSTAITSYRAGLNGYEQAVYLRVKVRDRETGDPHWYNFSSRDENESTATVNQETGELELHDFEGGGVIVGMDPLVRSEGTGVQNFAVVLSGTATSVKDMIQGYDCRDAVIEVHVGEIEAVTGLLVDAPVCEFEGFVDGADPQTEALEIDSDAPADSNFTLSIVSHIAALQRTNPDMRSDDVARDRDGDRIFRYAAESNTWDILWGKTGKKHKKDGDGDGRNHDQTRGGNADFPGGGHK